MNDIPPPLPANTTLFLDFDGTLVPLASTPDGVKVDDELRFLLRALNTCLEGRLAIVSGRSVANLRELGLGEFVLAGTHGLELAFTPKDIQSLPPLPALDAIEHTFIEFSKCKPGILVERKRLSVGLHFRMAPQWEAEVEKLVQDLADQYSMMVQDGKMLFELRPYGADKGTAIRSLMTHPPLSSGSPIFLGDDVTDENGFEAANELGGWSILVGDARPTSARYRLEHIQAVRHYLHCGLSSPRR